MTSSPSAGARFRAAVAEESPLQVMGAITAYAGLMAKRVGYKALYLSGGGVAANSLGMPDLGISTMEDVLTDARRIVDATQMPLLVDIDTGWGGAFNIAPHHPLLHQRRRRRRAHGGPGRAEALRPSSGQGSGADGRDGRPRQGRGRCAHRQQLRDHGAHRCRRGRRHRRPRSSAPCAYVEAGADMIFPEAMNTLDDYRRFKAAVKVPILANLTEFGSTPFFTTDELRDADVDIALYCCGAYRAMNKAALNFYETVRREGTQKNIIDTLQTRAELYDYPRLPRLRGQARRAVRARKVKR